jgi:hypothetical protein
MNNIKGTIRLITVSKKGQPTEMLPERFKWPEDKEKLNIGVPALIEKYVPENIQGYVTDIKARFKSDIVDVGEIVDNKRIGLEELSLMYFQAEKVINLAVKLLARHKGRL